MSSPRPPAPQHHISWQSSSLGWCSPEPGARSTEVRSNKSFTPPSRCARKDWGCPPCALAECPIPLHTTGAPCATTARPSITAPHPCWGKSGLPAAPHPTTRMQVTPCPSIIVTTPRVAVSARQTCQGILWSTGMFIAE